MDRRPCPFSLVPVCPPGLSPHVPRSVFSCIVLDRSAAGQPPVHRLRRLRWPLRQTRQALTILPDLAFSDPDA